MENDAQVRPPVAIGHVSLRVTDVPQATEYFVALGLRLIHQSPTFTVLELRGGTHLVLRVAEAAIPSGTKAPFDLMVDDVVKARQQYGEVGMSPSEIETGTVHRWFTIVGPDGYEITITSSHAGNRAV